ncbi:hypothetical protein OSTOST_01503 [Ostertagia ostertagi]
MPSLDPTAEDTTKEEQLIRCKTIQGLGFCNIFVTRDIPLEKYGGTNEIVTELHRRLEKWTARSNSLKDQRRLFDQISTIIEQLQFKGQDLNNPWLMNKTLSKFSENIQRSLLKEKVSVGQDIWTLQRQMECLDVIIKQEE